MKIYLIAISFSLTFFSVKAQEFAFHSDNPFGLTIANEDEMKIAFKAIFHDVDGDIDKDVLLFYIQVNDILDFNVSNYKYDVKLLENIGNANSPLFNLPTDIFTELEFPKGFFLPAIGDINGDGYYDMVVNGDVDVFTGASQLIFYINKGDGTFTRQTAEDYGLSEFPFDSALFPDLGDFDQDGDIDIMLAGVVPNEIGDTEPDGKTYYAKNIGDSQNPVFIGWFINPYHVKLNTLNEIFSSGDIDDDGDLDILSSVIDADSGISELFYKENQAEPDNRPYFLNGIESPFGLPKANEDLNILNPVLIDIDNDGDNDFFCIAVDTVSQRFRYYENTTLSNTDGPVEKLEFKIIPNPAVDQFQIKGSDLLKIKAIKLYDLNGKLIQVYSSNLNAKYRFDKGLNGTYILILETEDFQYIETIVILNQ